MKHGKLRQKSTIWIWILFVIFLTLISIIGSYFVSWFWILFLPLSFLAVVLFQAMSEHFWTPRKICPRCYAQISMYSEFCRNCGLRLIKKCPECGRYINSEKEICTNCGYELPSYKIKKVPEEYQVIKKGMPTPEKANFCPNCGVKLIDKDVDVCSICGQKID